MGNTEKACSTSDDDGLVGIGAAAHRFGLAESALRYWEHCGLIRPAQLRSRWRLYGPEELHRIGLIQLWRYTGLMSIEDITRVLTTDNYGWRAAVLERLDAIEQEQQRLAAAKAHLRRLLDCPDRNPAEDCPELRKMTAARAVSNHPVNRR